MEESNIIIAELAIHGIRVEGTNCVSSDGHLSIQQQVQKLASYVKHNKQILVETWNDVSHLLSVFQLNNDTVAGSDITQRMFSSAIKSLYKMSFKFASLRFPRMALQSCLGRDSNAFSETFMSNVIDYRLCIDWLHHLIREDMYKIDLLKKYISVPQGFKSAISGMLGNLDLPMLERVWNYSEDDEDFEDKEHATMMQERYQLPETYNKPNELEEGFYFREMRNEPYDFDDEDNNPYPHRNLLWTKGQ